MIISILCFFLSITFYTLIGFQKLLNFPNDYYKLNDGILTACQVVVIAELTIFFIIIKKCYCSTFFQIPVMKNSSTRFIWKTIIEFDILCG